MPEVAQVFARGDGVVENLDSVVRRSAARVRVVGNDARESTNQRLFIIQIPKHFFNGVPVKKDNKISRQLLPICKRMPHQNLGISRGLVDDRNVWLYFTTETKGNGFNL